MCGFHELRCQYDTVAIPKYANEGSTDLEAGIESGPRLQSPLLLHLLASISHQVILSIETVTIGSRECHAVVAGCP